MTARDFHIFTGFGVYPIRIRGILRIDNLHIINTQIAAEAGMDAPAGTHGKMKPLPPDMFTMSQKQHPRPVGRALPVLLTPPVLHGSASQYFSLTV